MSQNLEDALSPHRLRGGLLFRVSCPAGRLLAAGGLEFGDELASLRRYGGVVMKRSGEVLR
jgi:hypothetical protein